MGIVEKITDWPEGKDFRALPEKETCAQEAPPHNEFPEDERGFALFSDRSCCVAGNHQGGQVIEAAEGKRKSSQFAEVKVI